MNDNGPGKGKWQGMTDGRGDGLGYGMMEWGQAGYSTASPADVTQTKQDELAGKALVDKLLKKEITCGSVTDADFDLIGDYAMGQMTGDAHASMNAMMAQRMGDAGEKAMHIAMGKRLSGCNPNATVQGGMMGGSGQ